MQLKLGWICVQLQQGWICVQLKQGWICVQLEQGWICVQLKLVALPVCIYVSVGLMRTIPPCCADIC